MNQSNPSPPSLAENEAVLRRLHDPEFRRALRAQDTEALAQLGYAKWSGVEFQIVTRTRNKIYLTLPPLPSDNGLLDAEELSRINAGVGLSTVGSAGSFSTVYCFGTCLSSVSTVSTGGSVGSAGSAGGPACTE